MWSVQCDQRSRHDRPTFPLLLTALLGTALNSVVEAEKAMHALMRTCNAVFYRTQFAPHTHAWPPAASSQARSAPVG